MAHSYRNIAGRDSTHEAFDELAHGKISIQNFLGNCVPIKFCVLNEWWEYFTRTNHYLAHQKLEQADRSLINDLKPAISDLLTFTDTIIPDARETVRKAQIDTIFTDANFVLFSKSEKSTPMQSSNTWVIA